MGKERLQGTLLAGWNHHVMYETLWNPANNEVKYLTYLSTGVADFSQPSTISPSGSLVFKNVLGFTSKKLIFTIRLRLVAWAEVSITCGEGYQKIQNLSSWFSVDTWESQCQAKSSPASGLHVGGFFNWQCHIQKQKGARRLVKLGMMKIHHWFNQHLVITAWAEFPVENLCWIYDRIFALRKSYVGPMKSSSYGSIVFLKFTSGAHFPNNSFRLKNYM